MVRLINYLDIISLLSLEGLGRKTINNILKLYGDKSLSIKDIYEILKDKKFFSLWKTLIMLMKRANILLRI